MKSVTVPVLLLVPFVLMANGTQKNPDYDQYPAATIKNDEIEMKLFLPDPEKGLYRGTRFDWSGVIGSTTYKGHEYFGPWKNTHDPNIHDDLMGPVEGYNKPGLGYYEAEPGGKFIRIGVGIIEKEDEPQYQWSKTYTILDHGNWKVDRGSSWITFTHEIASDIGYGYIYHKTIKLRKNGFTISHHLLNTGEKIIETDQFNHNFFVIDGQTTGPDFIVRFPFQISTTRDTKELVELQRNEIHFLKPFDDNSIFLDIHGHRNRIADHQATIINQKTGAGVTLSMDQPLHNMVFWTMDNTICPENYIWISVRPGEAKEWNASYTLFAQ